MTTQEMKQNIVWLGHDSFRLDASTCIYIDPYLLNSKGGTCVQGFER